MFCTSSKEMSKLAVRCEVDRINYKLAAHELLYHISMDGPECPYPKLGLICPCKDSSNGND